MMAHDTPINETNKQMEARWQREGDARALETAIEVQEDPARLKAAKSEAVKMAKTTQKEADRLKKITQRYPVSTEQGQK